MKQALRWALPLMMIVASGTSLAQSVNSGDIRGTVTDTTGAVIPQVTVTVLNVDTGVSKDFVTNNDGIYDTSSLVTGNYKITFTRDGFDKLERGPITLEVGFTTVNAQLKVGSATTVVSVTSDIPLLKTETGEQSTTLEAKEMSQLPQVGQDWQNFVVLLAGAAGSAKQPNGADSSNPGQVASVNGNLPYSNMLADGASTTLSHSQNANPDIFETVAEVQISTSSFSAQYGIGGVIFNQISKGGTNQFHGAAYEYFQNDALNAAPYGFGNKVAVNFLRYDNFGGSIGGPILKKKMFFYFNYDQIINHGAYSTFNNVPTTAVLGGDFTGQPLIYDPTTQTIGTDSKGNPYPIRKSFLEEYGSNAIPQSMFDHVAAGVQQFYPTPSNHISNGKFVPGSLNSAGLLQNNFYTQVLQPAPYRRYFGRLDWDVTPNNRITMSDTQSDTPQFYPSSVFACPVGCQSGDVDNNNAQITDVWNISPTFINEARLGYTWQGNFFVDQALNKGYANKLGWQFSKADDFPGIQFGAPYPYAWITPSSNAVYKEHIFDPSDVVTLIRGRHILHFGGEVLIYQDNSTAWGNVNAGTLNYSGQYTQQWTLDSSGVASPNANTGLNYADFLLGAAQSWNASVSPEYGGRLKDVQTFIQDDFKVRPNLTLNLGLRYQIRHGWNEVKNNMAVFDPTITNPATNTPGAFWYGTTHINGRRSLQDNVFGTVLPRVGFSWLPRPDTTIRGGFGVYAYNWSLDTYGAGMGAEVRSSGSVTDTTGGITPVVLLGGSGTNLPYTPASTDPAAYNGQSVNFNQFHTPIPKIYQWNFAIQRSIGANMVAELAYVASHGFNLAFPVDINQVPEGSLSANDNAARPYYPNFLNVFSNSGTNNAISNYNSLQASIQKRFTSGLAFQFNYVWSHMLDQQDSSGWGNRAGDQYYQNSYKPQANYGASNFDVRNAFKGGLVYELPVGRGKHFSMSNNRILDEILGGWQASTIIVLSSGNPFTVIMQDVSNSQAQNFQQFPNRTTFSTRPANRSIYHWYNPAAFSLPANYTFGNERRNSVYGPGFNRVNISAGKIFSITEQVKLQIRADANNVFNHPSFYVPNQFVQVGSNQQVGQPFDIDAAGSQQINNTVGGPRTMQLGARLSF
jgi:hypothetical protein